MKNKSMFLTLFGLLFILGFLTLGCLSAQDTNSNENGVTSGNQAYNALYNGSNFTNDPVEGSRNAPVTIVEFSDFECPFCANFVTQTYLQIKQDYIDTGKVRLVYKYFPLKGIHPYAYEAAKAAECAHEQGKFWEYHFVLYTYNDKLTTSDLKKYAMQLGLNTKEFNDCLISNETTAIIERDLKEGQMVGIDATPAFFINGVKLIGAQPYSVFKQYIDKALAGK